MLDITDLCYSYAANAAPQSWEPGRQAEAGAADPFLASHEGNGSAPPGCLAGDSGLQFEWMYDPACYLTAEEIIKELPEQVGTMENDVLLEEQAA